MLKLFTIFLIVHLIISYSAYCETPEEKLLLADSLFAQKKYTQSFELYDDLQQVHKKASAAMLLKMAFIKEGLGDFTNALYYLNLYYLKTYNKRALKKMENLAEKNKLSGYNYDDAEFFLNLYHQYQLQIDLIIIALTIFLFSLLLYRRREKKRLSLLPQILFISFLALIFILNNFGRERSKAIVTNPEVHMMKGPSPGADIVDVVSMGHRVDILGKHDVWIKILWNDKEGYVKAFNLKPVEL
ncbi:MAG: SH3 domain-containing protein [Cytophagales bacterium]|nr:SH3 domain-containing protein [Cytophagales bacterium]